MVTTEIHGGNMNNTQQKLLNHMKKLIKSGKCKFCEERNDRDYLEDLADFCLSEDEAWNIILGLNCHFYHPDSLPNYSQSENSLVFKRPINGLVAYIKLILDYDEDGELVVCMSFHIDWKVKK